MADQDLIKKFGPKKQSPWKSPRKSGGRAVKGWLHMYLPAIVFVIVALSVGVLVSNRSPIVPSEKEAEGAVTMEELPVNEAPQEEVVEVVIEEPPQPTVTILDTPTGYLNVRSGPGTGFTQLQRVLPGEEYPFIEESDGWYHIEIDGEVADGWVINTYASISRFNTSESSPIEEEPHE